MGLNPPRPPEDPAPAGLAPAAAAPEPERLNTALNALVRKPVPLLPPPPKMLLSESVNCLESAEAIDL